MLGGELVAGAREDRAHAVDLHQHEPDGDVFAEPPQQVGAVVLDVLHLAVDEHLLLDELLLLRLEQALNLDRLALLALGPPLVGVAFGRRPVVGHGVPACLAHHDHGFAAPLCLLAGVCGGDVADRRQGEEIAVQGKGDPAHLVHAPPKALHHAHHMAARLCRGVLPRLDDGTPVLDRRLDG